MRSIPFKPYLIATAETPRAARFVWLYRKRRERREKGTACPAAFSSRFNKAALWVSTAPIAVAIGLPHAVPRLLDGWGSKAARRTLFDGSGAPDFRAQALRGH